MRHSTVVITALVEHIVGWEITQLESPFLKKIFYLFIHDRQTDRHTHTHTHTHTEAETQAEGEAGSMQEARCGTRSWVSRITPGLKAAA